MERTRRVMLVLAAMALIASACTGLADDRVTKIDETTGPTTAIEVGNGPLDLAVGGGAVWVTNSLDGTVSRIDPETNEVVQVRVGSSPEGIAIGDGSVWVTVHAL